MDEWEYRPPPDIDESMAEHLRNFPRQPYMLIYSARALAALIVRSWLRTYHRLRIDGRENLPAEGSFVFVCNHTSHLDTLCLLSSVPLKQIHRTFPAAAADYFFSSLPRSAVATILVNAMPFDREAKGAESLTICAKLLDNEGNVLIIFPEGTRTTSGEIGRFRSGIGRLLVGTDLQVLPCHLEGGTAAWPKGSGFPRPRRLHLRIGKPLSYSHLDKTAKSVRQVCIELQEQVTELGRARP